MHLHILFISMFYQLNIMSNKYVYITNVITNLRSLRSHLTNPGSGPSHFRHLRSSSKAVLWILAELLVHDI